MSTAPLDPDPVAKIETQHHVESRQQPVEQEVQQPAQPRPVLPVIDQHPVSHVSVQQKLTGRLGFEAGDHLPRPRRHHHGSRTHRMPPSQPIHRPLSMG